MGVLTQAPLGNRGSAFVQKVTLFFQRPMSVKVVATHIFLSSVHPIFLGEMIQFDELIFSYGLVQPATTSRCVFLGLSKRPLFEESSVVLFGLLKF